jgi:hypothetical protein
MAQILQFKVPRNNIPPIPPEHERGKRRPPCRILRLAPKGRDMLFVDPPHPTHDADDDGA